MHPRSVQTGSHPLGSDSPGIFHRIRDGAASLRRRITRRRDTLHTASGPGNRSHRRRNIIVLVLALLAYPVLGSAFLTSGLAERLVGSEDLKVELGKPAWTLWPGHFHVPSVRVLVNGTTQFKLEASHVLVQLKLFPLIHRHLHVTALRADGVRYWMRVQVQDPKGIEKRLAAYPKLDDLPGNPTVLQKKADQQESRNADFTVEVDGIDVSIAELWFMEYHYIGDGTLQGSFLVGPHRMRVGTSVQKLGPGELRFGATEPLIERFRGRIKAAIPDVNPEEHADSSFLELVTSDIELHGDIVGVAPLTAYTGKMRLLEGAGSFDTLLHLNKGALGDATYLRYATKKLGVRSEGFGVDTDWQLDARIDHTNEHPELPRVRSTSRATYVSTSNRRGRIFTVQVLEHEHEVVLRSPQLGRMTDIEHAKIHFPKIVTTDLDDLAALSSGDGDVRSKSGEARASLDLDVDAHHVARGGFRASFDDVNIEASGVNFGGRGEARGKLFADLDHQSASVRDVSVTVKDVNLHAGGQDVTGWWTTLDIPHVGVRMPGTIDGRLSLRAKNAAPLLDILVEKDQLTSLVPKLTSLPDVRVRTDFHKDRTVTDVTMEPAENTLFDVAGRFYSKDDQSHFAIVVGGKALSLGIAKKTGSGTSLMPFAREGWLNDQLKTFPPPLRQIKGSEP